MLLRRSLRRLLRWVLLAMVLAVILAALLVALASQLLPQLAHHPDAVAAWLSERSRQQISLDAVAARWSRAGPRLQLIGLQVGAGNDAVVIERAELQVNAYRGWLPSQALLALRVDGPDLQLLQGPDGRWRLTGFQTRGGRLQDVLDRLQTLGELHVSNGSLRIEDPLQRRSWRFERIDARLQSTGSRYRLGALLRPQADGAPLRISADFDRDLQGGRLYVEGRRQVLSRWLGTLQPLGVELREGDVDLRMWVDVVGGQVGAVQLDAELADLSLRGSRPLPLHAEDADADASEPAGPQLEPRFGISRLELALRWQRRPEGWDLRVDSALLEAGDASVDLSRAQLRQREQLELSIDQVPIALLATPLALAERPGLRLRHWLYNAQPRGQLRNLRLRYGGPQDFRFAAEVDALRALASGGIPGVQGIGGGLIADASAVTLALDPAPIRFDSPTRLREPIDAEIGGLLAAYRDAPGWRIEAAPLQIRGIDFSAIVEGALQLQGDGSRPLIDATAVAGPAPVLAARRFWILDRIPPATVEWLDRALRGGEVVGASAVFRGDADDWPFDGAEGVFEARAEVVDAELDYLPDWPHGENIDASVRFRNRGFEVEAAGLVLGNRVEQARGRIEDLKAPILDLRIEGSGDGPGLLALLRNSPLDRTLGPPTVGLSVGGRASVRLGMTVPLKRELGEFELNGTADLVDADLRHPRWGLRLDDASGRLRFTRSGFSADELSVRLDDQLASLSLAVGDYTAYPANVMEATLRGRLRVRSLVDLRPELEWLRPHVDGSSEFALQLDVPMADAGIDPRLRLRSPLDGVRIALPAPLRKSAGDALPLDLQLGLGEGATAIDLGLGQLLRMKAESGDAPAAFRGTVNFGGDDFELPPQGLRVRGDVAVLASAEWVAQALGQAGDGFEVESVDVRSAALDIADRSFGETRVRLRRDADAAWQVELDGEALIGSLQLPANPLVAPIRAQFQRLYWPAGVPGEVGAEAPPSAIDPSLVPALQVDVEDLRFGAARLGRATLRTRPTADGLRFEQLDTDGEALSLRAVGDWVRTPSGTQSQLSLGFTAPDLGEMIAALGFDELVEGGETEARIDASWPGTPSEFSLERVEGSLQIDVGKGNIPEVEPGAGRLLGLLSLGEIPRRLSLDFSDFFRSGFAFNRITGTFSLRGGSAYTGDLVIAGPAAEIRVTGRTGLRAQDYDQRMEVLPRAGSVLPALGALAGGPAGAAIGAVAQAVLQAPMKQMTRTVYQVSGPWSAPEIEVIERGPERAAQRDADLQAVPPDEPAPERR